MGTKGILPHHSQGKQAWARPSTDSADDGTRTPCGSRSGCSSLATTAHSLLSAPATEVQGCEPRCPQHFPTTRGVISRGGPDEYRGEGREISCRVRQLPVPILAGNSQKGSVSESGSLAVVNRVRRESPSESMCASSGHNLFPRPYLFQ